MRSSTTARPVSNTLTLSRAPKKALYRVVRAHRNGADYTDSNYVGDIVLKTTGQGKPTVVYSSNSEHIGRVLTAEYDVEAVRSGESVTLVA